MGRTADRVIRFLVEHARCADCAGTFRTEDVHVLCEDDLTVWDLGAVCHDCRTLTLLRAVVSSLRPEGTPTPREPAGVDELTPMERRHFASLDAVAQDDVSEVAAFLRDFDGDFRALFGTDHRLS